MLARERMKGNPQLTPELETAKQILHEKGWSYRTAAPFLGVHYTHLARVLTGFRASKSLLRRIQDLPRREGK
jgi:hypothetical protein|nr:MAG TPA: centromere-binding protein [Caudoviricetes sp.]